MSDPRPRPEYGEYATPEEQRARIAQPDATYALETGQSLDPQKAAGAPESAPWTSAPPVATGSPGAAAGALAAPGKPRLWDRVLTFALLGYGLFNVAMTIAQLLDFSAYANQMLQILGIDGTFTNVESGQLWGTIAAVVTGIGWLITAALAVRQLRRGRVAWWIPIVGAVATILVSSLLVVGPLLGDPVFTSYFSQ